MAAQLRPTRPRAELAAEEAAVALAWVRRRCPGAVDESTSLRAALRSGVVLGRLAGALGLGDCAWRAVDERALGATTAAGSVARLRAFENVAAALALLRAEFESSTRLPCERYATVSTASAALRDLDESHRFVQTSAESTSTRPSERILKFGRDHPNQRLHSAQALLERRGAGVARSGVDAHDVVNAASDAPALAVVFALTRFACRRDEAGRGGAARDVTREAALEWARNDAPAGDAPRGAAPAGDAPAAMPLLDIAALDAGARSDSDSDDDDAAAAADAAPGDPSLDDAAAAMRTLDPARLLEVALSVDSNRWFGGS